MGNAGGRIGARVARDRGRPCDQTQPDRAIGSRGSAADRDDVSGEHGQAARADRDPLTLETAAAMGVELLTEAQYRELQQLGEFDTKTSSWIATPPDVRSLGGALFCDRRYGKVFVYHNGAQSYYAARGFRSLLRV
ncbi:MAG: DUF4256 domain-containing protein [Burkholderiales bacterium]|nr:DUF4256 domain-containing protein [Burkholderiales bacterium]